MATAAVTLLLFLILSPTTVRSQDQQADRIIEAMIGPSDLRQVASYFLSAVSDQLSLPLSATIFVPSDLDPTVTPWDPLVAAYHIVPRKLTFSDLRRMAHLSRLPTLLPGNSILITNNSYSNFTLDDSPISQPDLFLSTSLAMHGVASELDFEVYGGQEDGALPGFGPRRPPRGLSKAMGMKRKLGVVSLAVCVFMGVKILF